jgi:NADH-quinone oxidoreductase subunit G
MFDPKASDIPKPQLVNLTIDDKAVSVPKGTNVILAAKSLGIHIPHYCYHEKLSISGNCRMCLIEMGTPKMTPDRKPVLKPDGTAEIAWIPRPQIGCATSVSEGMAVKTNSKMVEDCRKGVMEFLLINHPLDCPICDQAGECHLQEYSVEYGGGQSRFVEEKVHKPKHVQLGPRVTLDDERCILCSRCIRFSKEIAKDDVLGFFDRGSHTTLGCAPGKALNNNYSLNTVDLCPVGALTSTDFRFKMRVWFLKETSSVCTSCSTGCNITVGSREGTVHRYTPRRNDAVNSDWMCDFGRLNYKWINDDRRIASPLHCPPSGGAAHGNDVDWDFAFACAQSLLKTYRGRLAILGSGRSSSEELYLLKKVAKAYQANITEIVKRTGEADDILLSADRNPNSNGAQLMGITQSPGTKIQEITQGIEKGEIQALLVIQECAVKAGIPVETLKKLKSLIVVDILPSETTRLAELILPGSTHLEKRGTFINGKKRIQRFHQALPPRGLARPDWEILKGILPEDDQPGFSTFAGLFQEMCRETPPLQSITWDEIGDGGADLSKTI